MILETIVVSGSMWVGRRIYTELTKGSAKPPGIICPRSIPGEVSNVEVELADGEQASCQHLAVTSSGLVLAIGSAIGSTPLALITVGALGSTVVPLVRDGWRDLRDEKRINYGLLVTAVTLGGLAAGYLVLTSVATTVYFGSEVLLAKTRRRARKKIEGMFDDWPVVVWIRCGDADVSVQLMDLSAGDVVVVRAGETIPVDGTVVAGAGGVDQSMITGESGVAEKTSRDIVFASTLLVNGTLDVEVEKAGRETLAGQIGNVLDRMDSFEAAIEHRGVKVAESSVHPTLAVAAIGLLGRGPVTGLTVAASNFADSSRLTSPLSMLNYLRLTADAGIHVKDGRSLELLGDVDTIVFDKTGTLTVDRLRLVRIQTADGYEDDREVLSFAAAAEERQQHPIAIAIRESAAERGLSVPLGMADSNSVGNGISAQVDGRRVLVGSQRYMVQEGIEIPARAESEAAAAQSAGQTVVHVAFGDQWVGQIMMESFVRPEAADLIASFHAEGYKTAILSGDHPGPTQRLAKDLGIGTWRAGVLPHEKTKFIEALQADGRSVCFVGDGINDGMALKAANVSVSLNGASLIATDAAQVVLQQASLSNLRLLFELSRRFRSDQQLMQRGMIVNSTLSAGGALFMGLTLPASFLLYIATLVSGGAIAVSPLWRRVELPDTPQPHPSDPRDRKATDQDGLCCLESTDKPTLLLEETQGKAS